MRIIMDDDEFLTKVICAAGDAVFLFWFTNQLRQWT